MSHTSEKKLVLVAAWGFVLTGVVLVSHQTLLADEPPGSDRPANQCQVRVEVRGKIPFLEKIPLVKYFINTVGEQPCTAAAKEKVERIGVDFDLMPGHMVAFLPSGEQKVICNENGCPACAVPNVCSATKTAARNCKTCTDAQCESSADVACAVADHDVRVAEKCLEIAQMCDGDRIHQCCEHIAELRAENAALHMTQEARESILEARSELFEAMLELSTEKAKLEARVEMFAERDEMREKLLDLVCENRRLQATVELAEERQTLLKQSMEVALENERLKLHVAELEQRDSTPEKVSRTAKKPRATKKTAQLK